MSSAYDLDLFLDETYEIKLGGETYTLPKQPMTGLYKKITAIRMKVMAEMKKKDDMDENKMLSLSEECVLLILGQNKEGIKIDSKLIDKLNQKQLTRIIEIFFKEIQDIEEKN